MLSSFFLGFMTEIQLGMLGVFVAFVGTFLLLNARFSFLPQDQGRAFAINGQLSKGKLRGVGIIFTIWYAIVTVLFLPVDLEYVIMCVLLLAIMFSGYFDDAAETPWSDYKKGAIDFVISIICVVTFIWKNSTDIYIFDSVIHLHPIVYGILAIVLIWMSINVVNCSDGVDGLCGSLSMVTILSYVVLFSEELGNYQMYALVMVGAILAYLYFNCSPSSMLMGDAGSRAFGFFIAILAMKSQHPLSFLLLALVMILDGGLGLAKIFLLRFFKIHILKNTRTPLHDEARKNRGWSDTQVVLRFVIVQIVVVAITMMVM